MTKFFLTFMAGWTATGGVKNIWENNIYYCFISLETANTQKSEVFLLRISSGNVNALVVTCQYPQIYNFSFRKEFLETLGIYLVF